MGKRVKKRLTVKYLEKLKAPKVVIIGLMIAAAMGWTGWRRLESVKNYYQFKQIFPTKTYATEVLDGDTLVIKNGLTLRLLGIDAPNRGKEGYEESRDYLSFLVKEKQLTLEYDQYQDDKFGRILAYVWIDCIEDIKEYCREDKALVNEIMIRKDLAKKVVYEKRKKLKYDDYIATPGAVGKF